MRLLASILTGVLLVSTPSLAVAATGLDPNDVPEGLNFRRRTDMNSRYRRNSRAVERATVNDRTGTGVNVNTFEKRAETLREAQLRRIREDINQRQFSGESRSNSVSERRFQQLQERQNRRVQDALRRRRSPNTAAPARSYFRRPADAAEDTDQVQDRAERQDYYYRIQQLREMMNQMGTSCEGISSRRRQACRTEYNTEN